MMKDRIRVVLESPFNAKKPDGTKDEEGIRANVEYAERMARISTELGEAPFASHLFYTRFLDDFVAEERRAGIESGLTWQAAADLVVVCTDRGISPGMREGVKNAEDLGIPVIYRSINETREQMLERRAAVVQAAAVRSVAAI